MSKISFLLFLSLTLIFNACSSDTYDGIRSRMAGNKSPSFFHFSTPYDANHYMFHQKYFDILMPQVKKNDWLDMEGWDGLFINGGDNGFAVGLDQKVDTSKGGWISYHISVSSSRDSEYTQRVKAIEDRDIGYLRKLMPLKKRKNGDILNLSLSTSHQGRENYSCIVRESIKPRYGKRTISYGCYKVDSIKSKVKKISITLTYTKSPNLPAKYKHLAKEYTYEDLKTRAKRMLDSLYIKDGWSK